MLKVLNQDQIRRVDAATQQLEPISSTDLMERASKVFSQWFLQKHPSAQKVMILAGTGNNGGDGLAVARHLHHEGHQVRICVAWLQEKGSIDFQINLERLERLRLETHQIRTEQDFPEPLPGELIIDALLGSGINRPLEGLAKALCLKVNSSGAKIFSIDLPSGLMADEHGNGVTIKAHECLSFELPKRALLLPDSAEVCAHWTILPIGLHPKALAEEASSEFLVQASDLKNILPLRPRFCHKGDFGHVVVVGGARGMRGAAWLSGLSALRSGAGLTSCWLSEEGPDFAPMIPELMHIQELDHLPKDPVFALGPGMGRSSSAKKQLKQALERAAFPPVVDADALNILAHEPSLMERLPAGSILTPHPGEFKRLFGPASNSFEQLELLRNNARRLRCVIVLKGAYTCTASVEGELFFNSSGNPGMATGGSGDVLTGVIAALRAQGLSALQAAWAGVMWHGLAADRAALKKGEAGLLARDIAEELPGIRRDIALGESPLSN